MAVGNEATDRSSTDEDRTLVAECLKGSETAFAALYNRYAERIYRHLVVLLGPGTDAEDALQQTFLHAFRRIDSYSQQSKLSTWLHGIAVRVALNTRRGRSRKALAMKKLALQSVELPAGSAEGLERAAETRQALIRLEETLHRLSPNKRVAFTLYYVEQKSVTEVAELVGAAENTVWKRIKRAQAEVIAAMSRHEETSQ